MDEATRKYLAKAIGLPDPSAKQLANALMTHQAKPSKQYTPAEYDIAKQVATGKMSADVAYGEKGLQGGVPTENVTGLEFSPLDLFGTGIGTKFAALGGKFGIPALAGTFIGKNAKTFNHAMQEAAQKMEAAGHSPEAIWKETGTFKGADGHWRQEIDDSLSDYHPGRGAEKILANAEDTTTQWDDALYLRNFMDKNGSTIGEAKDWYIQTFGRQPHKFAGQHAKFSNADEIRGNLLKAEANKPSRLNWAGQVDDVLTHQQLGDSYPDLMASRWYVEQPKDAGLGSRGSFGAGGIGIVEPYGLQSGKSTTLHELQHAIQQREGWARGGSPDSMWASRGNISGNTLVPEAQKIADENLLGLNITGDAKAGQELIKNMAAHEAYRRLAGEAEARLTQARMNMTPAERAASYPPSMFDVPMDKQIVRMDDGMAMSAPKTEFELAHEVAQRNAALPVEQGGLGLPANNTAMDRAKAMGFDVDKPLFHGTGSDITTVDMPIFTTDSAKSASRYAKSSSGIKIIDERTGMPMPGDKFRNMGEAKRYIDAEVGVPAHAERLNANVMPVFGRDADSLVVDANGRQWNNLDLAGSSTDTMLEDAIKKGYGGVTFKNVMDNSSGNLKAITNVHAYLPQNIRSRFAAFDPMKRDSANILAGGAAAALGLGSILSPEDERTKLIQALKGGSI